MCATTAGLDRAYGRVFIALAGGDLFDIIQNGQRDAQNVKKMLEKAGFGGEQLRAAIRVIEPLRLAHRVDAGATFLFSATQEPGCAA